MRFKASRVLGLSGFGVHGSYGLRQSLVVALGFWGTFIGLPVLTFRDRLQTV